MAIFRLHAGLSQVACYSDLGDVGCGGVGRFVLQRWQCSLWVCCNSLVSGEDGFLRGSLGAACVCPSVWVVLCVAHAADLHNRQDSPLPLLQVVHCWKFSWFHGSSSHFGCCVVSKH